MAAALQGLQCPTTQICLSSCPSDFWSLNPIAYAAPPSDLYKYFKQELCVPSFNLSTTTLVRHSSHIHTVLTYIICKEWDDPGPGVVT
ncbi:choline transporter-like protein 4 [Silurus meridionalis]|nr:choline transporter-like protein 4 [Silurus meridionalis]